MQKKCVNKTKNKHSSVTEKIQNMIKKKPPKVKTRKDRDVKEEVGETYREQYATQTAS